MGDLLYRGVDLTAWSSSQTLRRSVLQLDRVPGLEREIERAGELNLRRGNKLRDALAQPIEDVDVRKFLNELYLEDAWRRYDLWKAQERTLRGPFMSDTIPQLPQTSVGFPTDLMIINRNGISDFALPLSGLPAAQAGAAFVFNVKLPPYNAVGNGTTDDTAAIQAAATAIANSPFGGLLYLPAGQYKISTTLMLPSNCTMKGDGAGFTWIIMANNFVGQEIKIGGSPSLCAIANSQVTTASSGTVQSNITIQDLSINGNGNILPPPANNAGGTITTRQVYNIRVQQIEIVNTATHGIQILGNDNPAQWPGNNVVFRLINNHINLNYNPVGPPSVNGVFPLICRGASAGVIENNITGDLNVTIPNDSCDIPGCNNVVVADNLFYNGGDGIGFNSANGAIAVGNVIQSAGGQGITSYASGGPATDPIGVNNITVTGNAILNSGSFSTGQGKQGIELESPNFTGSQVVSARGTVTGNLIAFSATAVGPTCIHIQANYCTVTGNTCDLGNSPNLNSGIQIDTTQGGANFTVVESNIIRNGNPAANSGAGARGIVITIGNAQTITGATILGNAVDAATIATPWYINAGINNMINGHVANNSFNLTMGLLTGVNLPALPASGSPTILTLPFDCMVTINGITLTGVSIAGNAIGLSTTSNSDSAVIRVPANATVTLTYSLSANPNWTWLVI